MRLRPGAIARAEAFLAQVSAGEAESLMSEPR
jgi:hypothetical protein